MTPTQQLDTYTDVSISICSTVHYTLKIETANLGRELVARRLLVNLPPPTKWGRQLIIEP